jgi:hypothetical protein
MHGGKGGTRVVGTTGARGRGSPGSARHPQAHEVIEYDHRHVFAQINGPKLKVVLDLEPIRPGEGGAAAALRLPGRLRQVYSPCCFDAVTMDAWYASDWWWVASPELRGYPAAVVYHAGRRRWGMEHKASNELTHAYHLEHCDHHEPVAMLAQMRILLLGFVLFNALAALPCQPLRPGQMSLKELAHNPDLAWREDSPGEQWFACG